MKEEGKKKRKPANPDNKKNLFDFFGNNFIEVKGAVTGKTYYNITITNRCIDDADERANLGQLYRERDLVSKTLAEAKTD